MSSLNSNSGVSKRKSVNNFGKKGWAVVLFTLLLYMFSGAVPDTINVTVTAFAEKFSWDSNAMLSYTGIGGFIGIPVALIFGLIIKKTNVKAPTVVLTAIFAVLWFLNGRVTTIAAYGIITILITAVSNTVNLVSTQQIMSNWFPRKKGIALGWATMGMPLAGVILVPLFQVMFGSGISAPFTLMAILTLVLAAIALTWFKSYPEEAGAYPDNEAISEEDQKKNMEAMASYKSPFTIKKLFATKQFWFIIIIFGLLFFTLVGTVSQIVPRLIATGMSSNQAVVMMSVTSALGIPASYLWGFIDQKCGTKKSLIYFCIVWIVAMAMSAIGVAIGNIPLSVISSILAASGLGGLGNLMPSMEIQVFGRYDFSAANSLIIPIVVGMRSFSLIAISSILSAAGANVTGGFRNVFILFTIIAIIVTVFAMAMDDKTIGKLD